MRLAGETYTVQPGDTLSDIAVAAGVTVAGLMQFNGITDADRVHAGTTIRIRPAKASATSTHPATAGDGPGDTRRYTVQPGDTLTAISQRLGVPASALAHANGLDQPDQIIAGTTLAIPRT